MDATNIGVSFSLDCWSRHDEEAGVLVGYIPALRLYSQGHDDEELTMAIGEYIDKHNQSPKPFIWTAKASDILEKVKRARHTLDNRHSA